MAEDDPIARLARQMEAVAKKDEHLAMTAEEVAALRRCGASELHSICAGFVASVNSRLGRAELDLSPATSAPDRFKEGRTNIIQIASQGRDIQIAFGSPREPVSTEKFLIPYVLEGEVRAFNQKMLERFEIRTELLFFCVEQGGGVWRFFDWRTRRTGILTATWLASLMERLL